MNTIEHILKNDLNLSGQMCDRFIGLTETKHLKKKEFFVEQGKVCNCLGIIEKGVFEESIPDLKAAGIKEYLLEVLQTIQVRFRSIAKLVLR